MRHGRLAACLAMLAMLASLPVAHPGAAEGTDADLEVSAQTQGDSLNIMLGGRAHNATVHVLVTHEDPLLGTVVDRVIPVSLEAGIDVAVQLKGLRPNLAFNIRVILSDVELPRVSDLVAFIDPARLDELPDVASLSSAPLPPLNDVAFEMHRIAADGAAGGTVEGTKRAQARVAQDGSVAAAWCQRRLQAGETSHDTGVYIAFSHDGGRTYGNQQQLTSNIRVTPCERWVLLDYADGAARLVMTRPEFLQGGRSGPLELMSVPDDGGAAAVVPLRDAFSFGLGHFAALPSEDGTILLAGRAGSFNNSFVDPGIVSIWRASAQGDVIPLGTLSTRAADHLSVLADDAPGGIVAVGWTEFDAQGRHRPYATVSLDGGATFAPPWPVPGIVERADTGRLSALQIDESGTLHVLVETSGDGSGAVTERNPEAYNDGYYIQMDPRGNPILTHRLDGPPQHALAPKTWNVQSMPTLAVAGERVWISWYSGCCGDAGEGRSAEWMMSVAVESIDHGKTFSAPYHLWEASNARDEKVQDWATPTIYSLESIAVFPDGRPLLLANGFGNSGLFSIPMFDPLAAIDEGLVRIEATPVAPAAPQLMPQTGSDDPRGAQDDLPHSTSDPSDAANPVPLTIAWLFLGLAGAALLGRRRG